MKAFIFPLALLFAGLSACGEPDTICACIETGRKLDKKAQEILAKGNSEEREKDLKALRKEKAIKCKEFERMDGPAMLRRMEDCD
jgi:hypothetical protein